MLDSIVATSTLCSIEVKCHRHIVGHLGGSGVFVAAASDALGANWVGSTGADLA